MPQLRNQYSRAFPDMPKTVAQSLVAAAFSNAAFAFPPGDDGNEAAIGSVVAARRIAYEWLLLYRAEIVPQRPSAEWLQYLTKSDIEEATR